MKKYLVFLFLILVGVSGYLYNYSLNIHIQMFRLHSQLYFKHQSFTDFADSILLSGNVKRIGFNSKGFYAKYFKPLPKSSDAQLKSWEQELKQYSIRFATVKNGVVFFYVGFIPYNEKRVKVSIAYNSSRKYSVDCLTQIKSLPQGQCNEKYNENWLISYFWISRPSVNQINEGIIQELSGD